MRILFLVLMVLLPFTNTQAQTNQPEPPLPLKQSAIAGAQIFYMGDFHAMQSWVVVHQGTAQYYYFTPDNEAYVTGLMFDLNSNPLTLKQASALHRKLGPGIGNLSREKKNVPSSSVNLSGLERASNLQSPIGRDEFSRAEQLFRDVTQSNWIAFGRNDAPVIYSFIDPHCPHCRAFLNDIRDPYIDQNMVQIRTIPVGFNPDSLARAAYLLSAGDPVNLWFKYTNGDDSALPNVAEINTQGVQNNIAIMHKWKLDVTPFSVYRARDGSVKIIQGGIQDMGSILQDLP